MKQMCLVLAVLVAIWSPAAAEEFEFVNNFLMNMSFVTFTDRGVEQNLDDNLSWMQAQGYTHLRFFGIFPNGIHCFPSPTLDANGYPNSAYHEQVLALLAAKAAQHNIVVNFDGWETIAEANRDTTALGVGYLTPEEVAQVVQEVLDLGVTLVTEEQFGSDYLQAIQATTTAAGATHETTAGLWYQYSYASLIADAQLVNVFNFFPRDQNEADSIIASGHAYDIPATVGASHIFLESPRYFGVPVSLAVGSFGTLQTENWRNVLRFAQVQNHPDRFSIEEQNHDFLIYGGFNFAAYIGNDLISLGEQTVGERPVANLVIDRGTLFSGSYLPTWQALLVDGPAIAGAFTSLGYRVVATVDSVLPEAAVYYLLLTGGADASNVAPLPEYVSPLLGDSRPVFIQPTYGIPDNDDASDWLALRTHFGLPPGQTQTVFNELPETVMFEGRATKWSGIALYLTPCLEALAASQVDTTAAKVVLSGTVQGQETALIIENGNSWLVNSNVIHLEVSYILSSLLGGPLNGPAGADIVVTDSLGLIFAEYATDVDLALPWTGMTRVVRYEPSGDVVSDVAVDLDANYSETFERGELVLLRSLFVSCCEGIRGNVDGAGEINVSDLTYLVAFLFQGGPAAPCEAEADVDGTGDINVSDLTYLVAYLFSGGAVPAAC